MSSGEGKKGGTGKKGPEGKKVAEGTKGGEGKRSGEGQKGGDEEVSCSIHLPPASPPEQAQNHDIELQYFTDVTLPTALLWGGQDPVAPWNMPASRHFCAWHLGPQLDDRAYNLSLPTGVSFGTNIAFIISFVVVNRGG